MKEQKITFFFFFFLSPPTFPTSCWLFTIISPRSVGGAAGLPSAGCQQPNITELCQAQHAEGWILVAPSTNSSKFGGAEPNVSPSKEAKLLLCCRLCGDEHTPPTQMVVLRVLASP